MREDVQLELLDPAFPGPRDRLLEQRSPDAAAPVARRHHQPEIGYMGARGMRVAGEGQAGDDAAPVLDDEDGRVRGTPNRA